MLYLRSFLFNLICYGTLAFGCLVTSVYSLEFETCGGY